MSRSNLDIVQELYGAFVTRDNEAAFALYDPDIVWDTTGVFERFGPLGFSRVYHGHDGVRRFWREWLSAWSEVRFELVELLDEGDRVLAWLSQRNVGRATGIEVDQGEYGQL